MNLTEIKNKDINFHMNTFGERCNVCFTHGQGSTLYGTDKKEYLDFVAGIAVNALGYNNKAIVDTITDQAKKIMHCSCLYYIESQALLAEMLVENSCADKVFFANSGAEANEGAIKLARKNFIGTGKYKIISCKNSFHGRTLATVAATGQEKYQAPFLPMPLGFINVEYNNIEAVKEAYDDETCAVLLEVIQGEAGIIAADKEYLQEVRKFCDEKGILLIFDEVQTGMGRTGELFAYQLHGVEPDIFTLAKGLGGGIPIGAVLCKDKYNKFTPGNHASTFGGNPLSCSVALTVLDIIKEKSFLGEVKEKGSYFKNKLEELAKKYPDITVKVKGSGLMLGLQINNKINGREFVPSALDKGLIINCAGNNTLRFVPPLIIKKEEIDICIKVLDELFSKY